MEHARLGLPGGWPNKFGTILADPPWAYMKTSRHGKLSGYSDVEYDPLTTDDLCALPVTKYADTDAVLLLWTTWPFLPDALRLMEAWGFAYVTGLPWVKATGLVKSSVETDGAIPVRGHKPVYGVGFWMRGATEIILVGKRPKGRSVRTNYVGLLSENFSHSRKPDTLYQLAEALPGPYLELFARRGRDGWHSLGNEAPGDGEDIRSRIV